MKQPPSSAPTVVVIGAGVIGLSCALKLQSLIAQGSPSTPVEVLLVAKEWPTSIPGAPPRHSPDYASMWAGAHVRPIPASTPQLKREARWLKQTVAEFECQLDSEPWVGITPTLGIEHLEAPSDDYKQQTPEEFESETGLPGYRVLSSSELPQSVELGIEYSTFCVNAPVYCANLLRKFIAQGGNTVQRDLKSEWEAFSIRRDVKLVVNASGTGFGDIRSFPTRGQTVVTSLLNANKTITRQSKDGSWSFIIPRFFNGGTIIGGTKEPGNWQIEPDVSTRQRLLDRAEDLASYAVAPGTKPTRLQAIADVVGRRPTRDGGMRIQVEERHLTGTDGQLRTGHVLHAYGAGGRGYEISWGVANEVKEMASALLHGLLATQSKL